MLVQAASLLDELDRVAGQTPTARKDVIRCRGSQELTVRILVGILSRLREWLQWVPSRQLRDETLIPRERNDVVLIPTLVACILIQVLMISQLVCVVHEVLRVAERALRHVLRLV